MIKILMIVVLVLILLFGFGPFVAAFAAESIAGLLGCPLDYGSVHPCLVGSTDIGDTLHFMSILAWVGLATVPPAMCALIVWAAAALVLLVFRLKRRAG